MHDHRITVVPYDERLRQRLKTFGAAVRRARVDAGLSQEALADRADLHRTYVGSVERGERNISLGNAYALVDALHLPLAELIKVVDAT